MVDQSAITSMLQDLVSVGGKLKRGEGRGGIFNVSDPARGSAFDLRPGSGVRIRIRIQFAIIYIN